MADDLPEYQTFGVAQGCACEGCSAPAEFHHPKHQPTHAPWARPLKALGGKPGKGQRCSDWFGFGMCVRHHGQLHAKRGPFANMSKEELRVWQDKATRQLQLRWGMQHPDKLPRLVEPRAKPSKLRQRRSKRERAVVPASVRERFLQEVADWAGNRRLKDNEHQLIHDLINDLKAEGF